MRPLLIALGVLGIVASGCDSYAAREARRLESLPTTADTSAEYAAPKSQRDHSLVKNIGAMGAIMERGRSTTGMMGGQPAQGAELPAGPPPQADAVPRKIIYTAEIALIVEDFAKAEPEVGRLVTQYKGYIADMQLMGSPGSKRSARWKVRVPVDAFESFLADAARLGELERNSRKSEDVSETYYDLEARIKNKQVEEQRLQKILEESTGKIEDVLRVETELSRVRGEIEQAQGRLRLLENMSSLTTITIDIRERENYQPPPPTAPSFTTQIERTFADSRDRLVDMGKGLVLFAVDIALWLPLWLIGLLIAYLVVRFAIRWLTRNAARLWALAQTPLRRNPPTS